MEFRHASWVEPEELERPWSCSSSLGSTYVCVDEPRLDGPTVLPPLAAATADTAYVRFHGRNAATWNARVGVSSRTLQVPLPARANWANGSSRCATCGSEAATTYLMFNNCFADYAPRNAQQMLSLLDFYPARTGRLDRLRP